MPARAKAALKKPATAKRTAPKRKQPAKSARQRIASGKDTRPHKPLVGAEQPLMKALRAEHRHMSSVMQLFAAQLQAIEAGELVDTHVVYEIMHYMVTWPDRFHHPREDLIYARVAELAPARADDLDTLQRDHDEAGRRGRTLLRDIERWRLGELAGTSIIKSGRAYIDHTYEHMNLEEKLIFPQIEETLSLQDWRELAADDQLKAVTKSIFGPKVQREFRNMARKLRRSMRRSVESGTMLQWVGIEAFLESLEVVSIAYDSTRESASDSIRGAVRDAMGFFREAPLSAPLRCAANNTRLALRLLGEVASISRETIEDLSRVNQERKDRVRLLNRHSPRR
jgi:hemerythrin-like domain-containing protein